jgi:hypothetical protein
MTSDPKILPERERRTALRLEVTDEEQAAGALADIPERRRLEGALFALGVTRDELLEVENRMPHDDDGAYIRRLKAALATLSPAGA